MKRIALMMAVLLNVASAFVMPGGFCVGRRSMHVFAIGTPSAPRLVRTQRRTMKLGTRLAMNNQQLSPADQAEYEALLKQAQELQSTFDSMIGNAFGERPAAVEEPAPSEACAIQMFACFFGIVFNICGIFCTNTWRMRNTTRHTVRKIR